MTLDKHELRHRWSELRTLMNEWDPIGLVAEGAPLDEYECVSGPLLRRLESGEGATQIATWLAEEFEGHFGVGVSNTASFAERIVVWYQQR